MLSLFSILRSTSCVYLDISRHSNISFYYFSMFKICSSRHSSFILYTPSSSIVVHLSSGYTLLDRARNFYSTLVLFSHSFKHAQIPLPHAFPYNLLSIHFLYPSLRSPLSRASFSKSIPIGLLFYLDP